MNTAKVFITFAAALFLSGIGSVSSQQVSDVRDFLGPNFARSTRAAKPPLPLTHGPSANEFLRHWNSMAVDASGLDHTPLALGDTSRVFGEQLGPARASRAIAIVHIAVFDAISAIDGRYETYTNIAPARPGASMSAAIAQAACETLNALFPSQHSTFDQTLAAELAQMHDNRPKLDGIEVGHRAAAAILALRSNDGSLQSEPRLGIQFFTSNDPGKWRQDPIAQGQIALGAYWGLVRPFVLQSSTQFRAPVPPAINSPEYAVAYDEVKRLGGDGIVTATERTVEQTEIGTFWAYDGTPSLCAPPRLYNEVAMHIADQLHTSENPVELARLLALIHVSLADAGIAIWESKFFYQYWRPVTGIRESDIGTGPSGLGDGNAGTTGDPAFSPLGAPASNLTGPNFTPPFPSYPSGHGGFGGALFQTLRNFYGRDNVAFTFVSDEFDGTTLDNQGHVRPLKPRNFSSFSQAEEENGQSRIYLGIHWAFDKTAAIAQGRQVANYVFSHAFKPAHGRKH